MNHDHHLIAWYGAIGMGGVLHTINPRLFDDQLDYIANHAEDRVLLYDRAFAPIVERMKPQWTTIEHYICFDPDDGEAGFREWIDAEDGNYAWVEGDERDPCGLCYTSGTTGNPKGVLYEHRSTMLHTMAEVAPDIFDLSARSVVLPIVPMFHANAWGLPWAAPMTGCKLVLSADYRPERMCDLFHEEKVTHSAGVPTVWLTMIDHIERTGEELGDLKHGHHRRLGRAAGDDPLVPRARHPGRPCLGHDRNVADRHGRRAAGQLGRDERRRAGRLYRAAGPRRRSASSFGSSTTTAMSCRATASVSGRLQTRGPWVVKRYFKAERGRDRRRAMVRHRRRRRASIPTARCRSPTGRRT